MLQDQRNFLFQIKGKSLTGPPEILLTDRVGERLVVNPQTLAFSEGGSWLVIETLKGSFVRLNLATLEIKPFAPAFGSLGGPSMFSSQVAVSDDGNFVAIANSSAPAFKVYDLRQCGIPTPNLQPENCPSFSYRPFVADKIPGLQFIRHLRFVNDGLLSFEAHSSDASKSGIYLLAPQAKITSLINYLGLGDSYTSGEGAYNYLAGTDTTDNTCHLSIHSYPLRLKRSLFSSLGGQSVACSGARLNDISSLSDDYQGQVKEGKSYKQLQQSHQALLNSVMANFTPGYMAQQRFVRKYQPAIITVSVGGNDVGFGDILERCVVPRAAKQLSDNTCFNTYEDRLEIVQLIDRMIPRWLVLYKQLQASAPDSRLYAIGYPDLVSDTGNCAQNVHLSQSELEFARELVAYMNKAISQAAAEAKVNYIDISQALVGHRLCEAASYNIAVNGLTAGKDIDLLDIGAFGRESYHPNAFGHQLIEQAIIQKTHRFTTPLPSEVGAIDIDKFLKAPKTGRVVNKRVPEKNLAPRTVKRNQNTPVKVNGVRNGLRPQTMYKIRLNGSSGLIIGQAMSDDLGNIETTINIPSTTIPGGHSLDIIGENQAGETISVTQPIYVPHTDQDADGDGLTNLVDSCPTAINGGQDNDSDGIDDVCDVLIDPPSNQATGLTQPASLSIQPITHPLNTTLPVKSTGLKVTAALFKSIKGPVFNSSSAKSGPGTSWLLQNISAKTNIRPDQPKLLAMIVSRVNWGLWLIFLIIMWLLFVSLDYSFNYWSARRRFRATLEM